MLTQKEIKTKVNKIGKTLFPKIRFVKDTHKKTNKGNRLIMVQNCETNEVAIREYTSLLKGRNPWNKKHVRYEERFIHPKVKSALKKLNLSFKQEDWISERSRVDFVCTTKNNRKILIEVKCDHTNQSAKKITQQIIRYKNEGKKKFGNLYAGTFLVSQDGTHGYSIKDLALVLKARGFA